MILRVNMIQIENFKRKVGWNKYKKVDEVKGEPNWLNKFKSNSERFELR